jgi:hypothetical protein
MGFTAATIKNITVKQKQIIDRIVNIGAERG